MTAILASAYIAVIGIKNNLKYFNCSSSIFIEYLRFVLRNICSSFVINTKLTNEGIYPRNIYHVFWISTSRCDHPKDYTKVPSRVTYYYDLIKVYIINYLRRYHLRNLKIQSNTHSTPRHTLLRRTERLSAHWLKGHKLQDSRLRSQWATPTNPTYQMLGRSATKMMRMPWTSLLFGG